MSANLAQAAQVQDDSPPTIGTTLLESSSFRSGHAARASAPIGDPDAVRCGGGALPASTLILYGPAPDSDSDIFNQLVRMIPLRNEGPSCVALIAFPEVSLSSWLPASRCCAVACSRWLSARREPRAGRGGPRGWATQRRPLGLDI